MNEESELDHNVDRDAVGPVDCVSGDEVVQVLKEIKTGEAPGSSDVSFELIATSGEVGKYVRQSQIDLECQLNKL